MPKMIVNGVKYAYRIRGNGEPVVLLHGFTGNQQQWDALARDLSADYAVLTVDLIGHGATSAPNNHARYAIEQCAHDLITLVQHLGLGRFHLLGYSMGGRLALYTALRYSQVVRSLILESASPGLRTETKRQHRREADNTLADQIEQHGMDWFADYWGSLALWDSQRALEPTDQLALREQRSLNNPVGLANSLRGMGTGSQPSLWDELEHLNLEVTLIVGALDEKFYAINEQMQTLMPDAKLNVVPGSGHNVHLENYSVFLECCKVHLVASHK